LNPLQNVKTQALVYGSVKKTNLNRRLGFTSSRNLGKAVKAVKKRQLTLYRANKFLIQVVVRNLYYDVKNIIPTTYQAIGE